MCVCASCVCECMRCVWVTSRCIHLASAATFVVVVCRRGWFSVVTVVVLVVSGHVLLPVRCGVLVALPICLCVINQ